MLGSLPWAQAQANKLLTATSRVLEVNGKPAKVFGLMGRDGKPDLTLSTGERFVVMLDSSQANGFEPQCMPMTDTELSDIASAATTGLSNIPKEG